MLTTGARISLMIQIGQRFIDKMNDLSLKHDLSSEDIMMLLDRVDTCDVSNLCQGGHLDLGALAALDDTAFIQDILTMSLHSDHITGAMAPGHLPVCWRNKL